jgi:alkylhydroperoxidase family enzyme
MNAMATTERDVLGNGRETALRHAPDAAGSLDRLEATAWQAVDADLFDLASRVAAAVHGYPPLTRPVHLDASPWEGRPVTRWRTFDDLTDTQRVVLSFAEQFSTDVSTISDDQRAALTGALGEGALTFAHALYVADVVPRARLALDRLFGDSDPHTPQPDDAPSADLWEAIQHNIRVVPGLRELDPITSELIRLRLARAHNCRICKSLRSYSAFAAGADDTTFDAVDRYEHSDLSPAIKAALALTDAMVWTPTRISDNLVAELRAHFTPAQQVELVLDIARNATNKFAVSMAVDDPHVTDGYEVYDVAVDGSTTYGLERP